MTQRSSSAGGRRVLIEADLNRYMSAMALPGGWQVCLHIEQKYGLDGYTPELVTAWLAAEAHGKNGDAAIDSIIGGEE